MRNVIDALKKTNRKINGFILKVAGKIKLKYEWYAEVNDMASKEPEQMTTDDAIILMFLTLVEEDGMEVPITLSVNGTVISGMLVGATAYYEGVTKSSEELEDSTMSKIISKKLNDLKEAYTKQKQEDKEKEESENSPTFIHLKNATYLGAQGQSASPSSGSWWRGRISSVDGFSFNFH